MQTVVSRLDRFASEDDGTMTIFSVLMTVMTLAIAGAAVDIMRQEAIRSDMQGTIDRAVLAAADLDQMQPPATVVADYLNKAGMGTSLSSVVVDDQSVYRTVTANGTETLDTFFLRMSGYDTLPTPVLSAAEERITNVEISLVLDISGSMRYNNRMDRLRPAAQDFVSKVLHEDNLGITTMNLVPFAGNVNPGDTLFDYFRGKRPKQNENNGWGNGDQDAPGGSLCNNGAENEYEGSIDPSCTDGEAVETVSAGFFEPWSQAISNMVFYFDVDGDDIYDVAHKIENFPDTAPRDADDFFAGAVAYLMAQDGELTDQQQFLGASIKGGREKTRYFQVKGDENGHSSDVGPSKNNGRLPGDEFSYGAIDFQHWSQFYQAPEPAVVPETPEQSVNINMPGSCIEIYPQEFATTAMPTSTDYVPHFHYWPIDREVMDWGWCPGEDTAIQYYTSDEAALNAFIADMRMHDGTGLHYGAKYGLALLDPTNRDEVGHLIDAGLVDARFRGRPIGWNDAETEKYMVIMTDGQTTDQFRPEQPNAPINGEVVLQEQGSGSHYNLSRKSENIASLQQQCALARSLGVQVFTIAFETNDAAAADMRECASSDSHFFRVSGNEIAIAFDAVARQINNLRLIQ